AETLPEQDGCLGRHTPVPCEDGRNTVRRDTKIARQRPGGQAERHHKVLVQHIPRRDRPNAPRGRDVRKIHPGHIFDTNSHRKVAPVPYPASIRISAGSSITVFSPPIRSRAERMALSSVSWVTRTTGTASPGLRPRCSIDSREMR